jgi:dTDP-4-amino-4,6-dideoxygalactose transaminase
MARSAFLPFSPTQIGQEEIDEVVETLRSGWITTGPKTHRFEQEFAAAVQAPAALAVNSCTAAMHLALLTMGVGRGDEVITSCWTFASTVNVIEHVGATPVIVDVEPDTLNLDMNCVAASVTPRTAAIIPVHFAGHPVNLDALNEVAARHGIAVVEDAAHALGASFKDCPIGSGPAPTAFSFYATKNLCTAEGGMLTGAPDFVRRARVASLHGLSRDAWKRYERGGAWRYDVACAGFKYNMTDIQASLGIRQLRKFAAMQERRRRVVSAYNAAFGDLDAFVLPVVRPEVAHAWHLYVLGLRPAALSIGRDGFIEQLAARNIGASVHFTPLPLLSHYREKHGWRIEDFPIARERFEGVVSLPLSGALSDQDALDVIEAVRDIVRRFGLRRQAA